MISSFQVDDQESSPHPNSHTIMALWAPFLLVHLGGPDTITAYALEDNELWLRHLLCLVVQVGVAFFIFLRYWTPSTYLFSLLAIPIFAGEDYVLLIWVLGGQGDEKIDDFFGIRATVAVIAKKNNEGGGEI
ncbi:hypothetical protein ACFX13_007009 [Malus domestica]